MKIVLNDITNVGQVSVINDNFDKIEQELQNKVLYRDNPVGEPNTLEDDLDVNGQDIYNVDNLSADSITLGGQDLIDIIEDAASAGAKDYAAAALASAISAANSADEAADSAAAALESEENALESELNAAESEDNAAASAAAAASSAALALAGTTYATLAAGEAAVVTVGARFFVRQGASYNGLYEYERTATGSTFIGPVLHGPKASIIAAQRVARGNLAQPVHALTFDIWGQDGWEWDGRKVPNRISTVRPTMNLMADSFNPQDELGSTPAREINTAATTDPLGGNNAEKLTATAQNQQLTWWRATYGALTAFDARVRLYLKTISGNVNWRLGTTAGLAVAAPAAWAGSPSETTIAGYTNAADIGVSSAVGNTDGVVAIAGAQILDTYAGESASAPTLSQELAAQNSWHLQHPLAIPGSIVLNSYGSLTFDGSLGAKVITGDVGQLNNHTRYSFGGMWSVPTLPSSTSGMVLGFDFHSASGGATGALHGQIGVRGVTSATGASTAGNPGKIIVNPQFSILVNKQNIHVPGEGYHSYAITMREGVMNLWFNRIPVSLGTQGAFTAPKVSRFLLGAYSATSERRKTALPASGTASGLWAKLGSEFSQEQISAQDQYCIENLRMHGEQIGLRKIAAFGCCDSTTAFGPSYWWHLGDNANLSPRMHGFLDAVGGSDLTQWSADPRKQTLKNQIAAAAETYDMVLLMMRPWTNETDEFIAAGYDYSAWMVEYLAYTEELKAVAPDKVKLVFITASVRPALGNDYSMEQLRYQFNQDWRDNHVAYGHDYLWDLGLGTERVDATGTVFTAETIPGGRIAANYRYSQGSRTYTRAQTVGIHLDALSGTAINVTTVPPTPGTFIPLDMWRRVTAGTGFGRIDSILPDGSGCTIHCENIVPTAYPGETAFMQTRDTMVYPAFNLPDYLAGTWTVNGNSEVFQSDGIHQTEFGGRQECDIVAPLFQAIQDTLTGVIA